MRYFVASTLCLAASLAGAAEQIDFQRDVATILQVHCAGCHSVDDPEGGFAVDSSQALLAGGDSGLAITPGTAASSRLWLMVSGQMEPAMPPQDEEPLSAEQLAVIEAWIDQGAAVGSGELPIKRGLRTPKIEPKQGVATPITAMASSPDGSTRAIARYGKIVIVGTDGSVISNIKADFGKVNSMMFSRDGSRLLVASGVTGAYGVAAVFYTETGDSVAEMVGHRDILYSAVYSPDESLVATAGYDREIILWDAKTGDPLRRLKGHNGAIFDLAFSPDGNVIVSACADETVKVWSVSTGQRLDTLSQNESEVLAVDVTSDGKFIVAVSADNRLRVWSLRSTDKPRINPLVATRFVDESALVNFAITPNGRSLVVVSASGNVKVIRTSDWRQAATLDALGETASDLTISPDSRSVSISLMNGGGSESGSARNQRGRIAIGRGGRADLSGFG